MVAYVKRQQPLEYSEVKNVSDTAFGDGKAEGKIEEKEAIARMMLLDNEPIDKIMRYTQLSVEQIELLG